MPPPTDAVPLGSVGPPSAPPGRPPSYSSPSSAPGGDRPAVEPVVIAARRSRRQARLERKRQQRRRVGFAGGAAIGIAAIVVIALVAFGVHKAVTGGSSTPPRTQTTLLLQVQGSNGSAVASALLAHDTDANQGVEVLIPPRVITDVCGYNTLDFGQILSKPGGNTASREAVSGMLNNITVDGSWVLSTSQLAKLITLEGGITIDVKTNVVQQTGGGGGRILVPVGTQKLTGEQAVQYATYIASPKEDATVQLPRLQQVIDATASALPRTSTAVAALVRQLGVSGESSLGATKLANFLVGFANSERATGALFPTDLPSNAIDAGGAPSYRVDTAGADNLVKNYFTSSLPSDAGTPRPTVELLNGVGTPGLVATTCPKLAAHRLTYVGSTNAANFNHPTSQVLVANSDISLGYTVADALGLPHSDVRRTTIDQTIADAIVTLGKDYKP